MNEEDLEKNQFETDILNEIKTTTTETINSLKNEFVNRQELLNLKNEVLGLLLNLQTKNDEKPATPEDEYYKRFNKFLKR